MDKTLNSLRLFLFTCSGEDNFILKRCKTVIQKRFAFIGFLVLLIFIGCFFSATLFSYSLFQGAIWASIPIGIFWGAMVVNMYLLLLHTISPAIIPLSAKKIKSNKKVIKLTSQFLTLSMFLRMVFMLLLAIIIAQPLNYSLLSSSIQTQLQNHKTQERIKLYNLTNKHLVEDEENYCARFKDKMKARLHLDSENKLIPYLNTITTKITMDSLFLLQTASFQKKLNLIQDHIFLNQIENRKRDSILNILENLLENQIISDSNFVSYLSSTNYQGTYESDFDTFKNNLLEITNEKIDNYNKLNILINKSNFYIKTIQILLVENPTSWLITILVCLAFLFPIFLKYNARNMSSRLFLENNKQNLNIIKLRQELLQTRNFDWLKTSILQTNIRKIRTSDYYFQRMLVEHKIIFVEYENCKKRFSEILTNRISQFDTQSKNRLNVYLDKLKPINILKFQEFKKEIDKEYSTERAIKFEYWLDNPFRSKKAKDLIIKNNETSFLEFIYGTTEDSENL
jgi:hypothetical protein